MEKKERNIIKMEPKKESLHLIPALLFIPGVFLVGLAFGVLFNRILVASLFGLGIGFILAAVFSTIKR
jgi:hypothetical protein